jgi:hypothetical protein
MEKSCKTLSGAAVVITQRADALEGSMAQRGAFVTQGVKRGTGANACQCLL